MNKKIFFSGFLSFFLSFISLLFIGFDSLVSSFFSIFVYVFFILALFKIDREFFLTNAYMFYGGVATLLISIILEKSIYLVEVGRLTYPLHIPEKAVIQLLVFTFGSLLIFGFLRKSNLGVAHLSFSFNMLMSNAFRLIVMVGIAVILLLALRYGTPLTHGVHRNDFWTYYAPSWGGAITYWIMQLTFILGILYSKGKNKIDVLLFLSILLTIFLMGERFTGLVYSVFFFSLPLLVNRQKINIRLSFAKTLSAVLLVVVGIGFTLYNSFSKIDSTTNPIENIQIRASLQPQMWWALDEITTIYPKDINLIYEKYFGFSESERDAGVYYLMDQVAPKSIVDARFETKSRFTMSGFFNNTYFYGYILGTLVNFLWGCFFGFISYFLYCAIVYSNIIFSFFAFKLFFKMQAMLLNATINDLFSIETLVFLFVCLFFMRLV